MKIWTNIFRKVEVLVLTKKLINWTDFSEIDDTVSIEQLPSDFCLLWALYQEMIPFLHHHTLFVCFIPTHRPPSDPQSVRFIIMISLFSTECCVPDTGAEKAPANVCWMNEWVWIPLSTISSGDIWLLEKLRFLLGILHNEVNCLLQCGHYTRYYVCWLPRLNRRCDVMRQYWQLEGWKLSFPSTWCLQI